VGSYCRRGKCQLSKLDGSLNRCLGGAAACPHASCPRGGGGWDAIVVAATRRRGAPSDTVGAHEMEQLGARETHAW
jgi:hypothetical protein